MRLLPRPSLQETTATLNPASSDEPLWVCALLIIKHLMAIDYKNLS